MTEIDDVLGKAYDARLMRRLLTYLLIFWWWRFPKDCVVATATATATAAAAATLRATHSHFVELVE